MIDDSRAVAPRPVRVGFVVHVMQVAGAEVLVRETVQRLGGAIVPTVFCLDRVGTLGDEMRADGHDVVCFDRRPGYDFSVPRKLAGAVRERGIEVLHAHQYTPFFWSALAKILLFPAPKLILTEHGRHFPDTVSPHRRAVNRVVLDRLADAVTACCHFSARALSANDGFRGNRIGVIGNGIEVDRYVPVTDRRGARVGVGLDPGRRVLVHVARHHPVKDQATLIRGFALAAAALPDVDLVLVGDGPLRGELESLARSLGVAGRVKFVGIQRNVPDWLAAADAFALTSVSEAASLTLLEAMATGLPVVVSAVGGNPEIVRKNLDGLHFARGDAAGLSECLRRLFADAGLARRLGASARTRAVGRYQLARTVEEYAGLYARLAGRPLGLRTPRAGAVGYPPR